MKLLLDTHVFLWWLDDDRRLGAGLRSRISNTSSDVWVSAASIWEIAVKIGAGKLALEGVDTARLDELVPAAGFRELAVTARHATAVANLPRHHGDPFDRLLVAQARAEGASLVSLDRSLAAYDVRILSR